MNAAVAEALWRDTTIDITTTGRRSGLARRIEIWILKIDDQLFITGTPGPRDWFANLLAEPRCTIHLKQQVHADLAAIAEPVPDPAVRKAVMEHLEADWYRNQGEDLDDLVAEAPMVEIVIDGWPLAP